MRVIESVAGRSFVSTNFEALSNEEILGESTFALIIVGRKNRRIFPVNNSGLAPTRMFGYARNMFVRFIGSDVAFVLSHPRLEVDPCLANVCSEGIAAAGVEIDALLLMLRRTRLVGSTKNISEFRSRFRMIINVI